MRIPSSRFLLNRFLIKKIRVFQIYILISQNFFENRDKEFELGPMLFNTVKLGMGTMQLTAQFFLSVEVILCVLSKFFLKNAS